MPTHLTQKETLNHQLQYAPLSTEIELEARVKVLDCMWVGQKTIIPLFVKKTTV